MLDICISHADVFFISGMWFRDRKPREYVIRKAKSYLIPFYGYSLLILTIDFILFRDKDFFVASIIDVLRGEGSFFLLWFLFSLFFVEIIYYVIYRLIKNKRSICIIAFILALIPEIKSAVRRKDLYPDRQQHPGLP